MPKSQTIMSALIVLLAMPGCGRQSDPAGNATITGQPPEIKKSLPVFEFRGLVPGVTRYRDAVRSHVVQYCQSSDRETSCELTKRKLGDVSTFLGAVYFADGKVARIGMAFASSDYNLVRGALKNAYGEPCRSGSTKLTNDFGVQLDTATTTWCFEGGELQLWQHSTGPNGRYNGSLDFMPPEPPRSIKPYTSKTL